MYTMEISTPTREPPATKLQIEMKIVFMKMLLKMNYVFSAPNSKKRMGKLWTFQDPNGFKV